MNVSRLEKLMLENKLSKTDICSKCGFTRPTLNSVLSGADVKISTIISLADFFNVSVGYFFDEDDSKNLSNELEICKKEIRRLKEIINTEDSDDSHLFLAIPINSDEFLDLREMKDKIIKVLKK